MGNRRNPWNVQDIEPWVTNSFTKDQASLWTYCCSNSVLITRVNKGCGDAKARKGVAQQIVATTIERIRSNDVRACIHNGHDG